MSSSEIPENISNIERMTDRLISLGAELMKDTVNMKIHSTGHGNQEDIRAMVEFIRPKYVMPIHGSSPLGILTNKIWRNGELIQTIFSLLMMGKFGSIQTGNGREGKISNQNQF